MTTAGTSRPAGAQQADTDRDVVRAPSRTARPTVREAAGALALVCVAQYFAAEAVAASAWHDPPYSWTENYISALGAATCSTRICSPEHVVVEASLLLHAALVLAAAALLGGMLGSSLVRRIVGGLVGLHALGNVVVALVPMSPVVGPSPVHYIAAAIGMTAGIAMVLVVGVAGLLGPERRSAHGVFSLVCGGIALASTLVLRWASVRDNGLPLGVLERIAVDPIVVWLIATGGILLTLSVLRRRPEGEPADSR